MPDSPFYPQTAREALLEIRRILGGDKTPTLHDLARVESIASLGLKQTGPGNFEFGDREADALGDAHHVLRAVAALEPDSPLPIEVRNGARSALTLPPDLEAVVERRIGPEPEAVRS